MEVRGGKGGRERREGKEGGKGGRERGEQKQEGWETEKEGNGLERILS